MRRQRLRSSAVPILAPLLAVVLALALGGCAARPAPEASRVRPEVRFSILALGDTGHPPRFGRHFHRQRAVGLGLAAEDRRLAADALLLLGDNFYDEGLERERLEQQVRENVVVPYCHFVDLSGPRSAQVRGACRHPADPGRAPPIHAVLGNHDYGAPESPGLQREALPEFVSNWRTPSGLVEVVEFPAGVSLVLLDSVALRRGVDAKALREALEGSRGPWRILAAHHPVARGRDYGPGAEAKDRRYRETVLEAIRQADVTVHLALAGHEHNLQIVDGPEAFLPLQGIAGSGGSVRPLENSNPRLVFAVESLGFLRVDLVGRGQSEELVVSVFTTGRLPLFQRGPPERVARWTIGRDARPRAHPLVGAAAGPGR